MKKKNINYIKILLFIVLLLFTTACQTKKTTFNVFNKETISNNKTGFTYHKLQFDNGSFDEIVAIENNNIIYYQYQENDTIIKYFKYDLYNNRTYEMGTIENPHIFTNTTARIGKKLYFYMTFANDTDDYENNVYVSLYEMDMIQNKLSEILTEKIGHYLVYVNAFENNLLTFKGKYIDGIGSTYIDLIDMESAKIKPITFLEEDLGESIANFSKWSDSIYTINSSLKENHIIKQYDLEGNNIREIKLEKAIIDLIRNEIIANFQVLGRYAFIRNASGHGALFDISGDVAIARVKGYNDLANAFHLYGNENTNNTLLFNRETCSLWLLDVNTDSIHELDTTFHDEYKRINYVFIDSECNALIALENDKGKQLFYLNYLELQIKKSYSLFDDVLSF